jgi:ribosomal protein L34E
VREVFERRAQGAPFPELAGVLEGAGVRTSQGSKTWTRQALQNMLASRVYLGELSYGRPPRYVNEHAHEPIVDVETWQAAQRPNGRAPQRPRSKTPGGRFTLTGIARCAACGYTLEATSTSRGKRMYRCSRRHAGGMCPNPARIDADAAERAFFEVTAELAAAGTSDPAPELAALEQELARAEERYARVKAPDMQDALGDDWPATVKARRQERDRAAEALGQARAGAASTSADVPDVATLRETWPQMAPADRRELLAARFGAVAVSGRKGEARLVAYLAGHEPRDLSKRGFAREPGLRPLDVPAGARVLPL